MAIEIKPLTAIYGNTKYRLFLAGSIEMGTAKPWRRRVVTFFRNRNDIIILNPLRDKWNASWKQVKSNRNFRQQVEWELNGLEAANIILMYFDPATKSPISLLELGLSLFVNSSSNMHVVCPPGFWRKGNVDIVCERYHIPQYSSLTKALKGIETSLIRPYESIDGY